MSDRMRDVGVAAAPELTGVGASRREVRALDEGGVGPRMVSRAPPGAAARWRPGWCEAPRKPTARAGVRRRPGTTAQAVQSSRTIATSSLIGDCLRGRRPRRQASDGPAQVRRRASTSQPGRSAPPAGPGSPRVPARPPPGPRHPGGAGPRPRPCHRWRGRHRPRARAPGAPGVEAHLDGRAHLEVVLLGEHRRGQLLCLRTAAAHAEHTPRAGRQG